MFRQPSLSSRIVLSMLALVFLCLLSVLAITAYDFTEHQESFNDLGYQQKEDAVKESMSYLLRHNPQYINPDTIARLFSDKICELSDVHDVFIALFSVDGRYILSSHFLMMDSLRIPERIPENILVRLAEGNRRAFIDKNFSGGERTLSYWHFNNESNHPLFIVNVVYDKSFDKVKEGWRLVAEIGWAFIVLFFLAALVAVWLSRRIIRPIRVVTSRVKDIQLQSKSEPLQWQAQDEIGQLISAYNEMIVKLNESASALAKSERQMAWREIAQQIAHDIKNPLTPMKLRIQQLQRSYHSEIGISSERMLVFCDAMLQQIDSLSRIAGEFSDYANVQHARRQQVDLHLLIKRVADMFQATHEGVAMHAQHEGLMVFVDELQLLRCLNNLIANAFESIPENRQANVSIDLHRGVSFHIIRITDNGSGIDSPLHSEIFKPHFTTKAQGSGLGLAVVAALLEQNDSRILFKSRKGKGTSFFILIPAITSAELTSPHA